MAFLNIRHLAGFDVVPSFQPARDGAYYGVDYVSDGKPVRAVAFCAPPNDEAAVKMLTDFVGRGLQ